jgi:hypothetical protein
VDFLVDSKELPIDEDLLVPELDGIPGESYNAFDVVAALPEI